MKRGRQAEHYSELWWELVTEDMGWELGLCKYTARALKLRFEGPGKLLRDDVPV